MTKIAAVTMAFNEKINLPIWHRYYAGQLGAEATYILDHGTTDGSVQSCYGSNVIRLPRDHYDNHQRAGFISQFCSALLLYFDAVIYTDADEIIVPDPEKYEGLSNFVERNAGRSNACVGVNVFHDYPKEAVFEPELPVLAQRHCAYFRSSLSKPSIIYKPVKWGVGFHSCDHDFDFHEDLLLFHLRFMDMGEALSRLAVTRSLSWSEQDLKLNPFHYQRLSDEEYVRNFADGRLNMWRGGVRGTFDTGEFVAELNKSKRFDGHSVSYDMNAASKPFEIPERFRGTF